MAIQWGQQPSSLSPPDYFAPTDSAALQFETYRVAATDPFTDEVNYEHPLAFQAKANADTPSIREVFQLPPGRERDQWDVAMDTEVSDLQAKGTFEFVRRSEVKEQVIPSTWVFRRKFKPDGTFSKLKARFCVRGDLQHDVVGETYAPVVDWGTLRLVFSLAMAHNLHTTQIDFKNAFVQSTLPQPIYLELPPGKYRSDPRYQGLVLKVNKSLYGDRRAPNLWYMHLRSILEQEGFTVSSTDPCLFLRHDCMVVCYVDDSIIVSKDPAVAQNLLHRLEHHHKMDFTREGDLAAYLGVSIANNTDGTLTLTQPALTRRIVAAMGLTDCRPVDTPAVEPLGRCLDAPDPAHEFNYRSVVGMLNYLANSTRLDISFAVHQCARFSANPRLPHEKALKRIGRYLAGTLDNGLIIRPNRTNLAIDCFCDADFAGLWTYEDVQDPTCTRSRTGYLLTLGGTPLLWSSRLQTETALSTMEAEYIALSTAMRALLPMRQIHSEILSAFMQQEAQNVSTVSSVWEDNQAALLLATATDPPRLTPRSKHIAIKYHWFRDQLSPDSIIVKPIATMEQKANILTKPQVREKFTTDRRLTMGW
jgi:histone deacetylase 1/2